MFGKCFLFLLFKAAQGRIVLLLIQQNRIEFWFCTNRHILYLYIFLHLSVNYFHIENRTSNNNRLQWTFGSIPYFTMYMNNQFLLMNGIQKRKISTCWAFICLDRQQQRKKGKSCFFRQSHNSWSRHIENTCTLPPHINYWLVRDLQS